MVIRGCSYIYRMGGVGWVGSAQFIAILHRGQPRLLQ